MKQKNKIIKMIMIFILAMVPLLTSSLIKAKADSNAPSIPFEVRPIVPHNQEKGIGSYFSLYMNPNQKQTVYIDVRNVTDKKMIVEIQPTNALSIKNGGIEYTPLTKNPASGIVDKDYAMADNFKVEKEVELNPSEDKRIPIQINTPSKGVGIYLGGVMLTKKDDQSDKKKAQSGFSIINKTEVGIAIQLIMPKADQAKIQLKDSTIDFIPSGVQIYTNIVNPSATVLDNLKGKYTVYDKNMKTLFSGEFDNFKMAPKTYVNFPVFWNNNNITAGDYFIRMDLYSGKQKIEKLNKFNIPKKDIIKYKKENNNIKPSVEKDVVPTWVWIVIGGLILIIFSILIYVFKTINRGKFTEVPNKNTKEEEEKED